MESWVPTARPPAGPIIQQLKELAIKEIITTSEITVEAQAAESLDCEHIKSYKVLEQDLASTAKRVLKNLEAGRKYDRVLVLGVYWHKSVGKPDHIAGHAEDLLAVFRKKYGYEVKTLELLDAVNGYTDLNGALHDIGKDLGSRKQQNLFILYYGGHGGLDQRTGQARHWLPDIKDAAESVDWYHLQQQLGMFYFDILFIFDCCYAMAMPDNHIAWKKRCEIVGAAGEREKAGGKPETSFTAVLTAHLREDFEDIGETNIWRVVSEMQSRDYKRTLKSTPQHRELAQGYASTISLVPLSPDARQEPSSGSSSVSSRTLADTLTSDARILIGIKTTNFPKATEFEKMLSFLPPSVIDVEVGVYSQKLVEFLGLFKSNSGLALISIPVWFWCAMDTNPAYRYIDVIRSENLLEEYRVTTKEVASPIYCARGVQTEDFGKVDSKGSVGGKERVHKNWRTSLLNIFPLNSEQKRGTASGPSPRDSVISRPSSVFSRPSSVFSRRSNASTGTSSSFSAQSHHMETISVNTWQTPICIIYSSGSQGIDVTRSAIGMFDSQSELDLMSSKYATDALGVHFENTDRKLIGVTITGQEIDSIGVVTARWASMQKNGLYPSPEDKFTLAANTHYATFHVIVSDHFDVIIGRSSLVRNGVNGKGGNLFDRFHSQPNTSFSAKDQEYLRRVEAERKIVGAERLLNGVPMEQHDSRKSNTRKS